MPVFGTKMSNKIESYDGLNRAVMTKVFKYYGKCFGGSKRITNSLLKRHKSANVTVSVLT